jgi:hypothetical protein
VAVGLTAFGAGGLVAVAAPDELVDGVREPVAEGITLVGGSVADGRIEGGREVGAVVPLLIDGFWLAVGVNVGLVRVGRLVAVGD